jgi:hypothetical protein
VPVADDQGGLGVVVGEEVGLEGGQVQGSALGPGLCDAGLGAAAGPAQETEGDRVAPGLGGEVAAEAERVHPVAQQSVGVVAGGLRGDGGAVGQGTGGGPQPPVVRRVGGAGVLDGLGGVLGQ